MCPALTPAAFGAASWAAAGIEKARAKRRTDAIVDFIADTVPGIARKKEGYDRQAHTKRLGTSRESYGPRERPVMLLGRR